MDFDGYWSYNPYYSGYYEYNTFSSADETCAYDDPNGRQPGRGSSILIPPFFSVFFI